MNVQRDQSNSLVTFEYHIEQDVKLNCIGNEKQAKAKYIQQFRRLIRNTVKSFFIY